MAWLSDGTGGQLETPLELPASIRAARPVPGQPFSNHAWGLAVDFN